MNIRVTGQTQINSAIANMRRQSADAAKFQDQISTGLRVKAASDDPTAFVGITQARAASRRTATYQQTLADSTTDLNAGVYALQETNKALAKARQLAITGANSGIEPASYETMAAEVDTLIGQVLGLANQQSDGRYLFGGTGDDAPPFRVDTTNADGRPATIAYDGAGERAAARIGATQTVDTKYVGSESFQAAGADVFASLIGLRDDLRNTTMTEAQKTAAISARIGDLESARAHVGEVMGEQSAALAGMESIASRLADLKLTADTRTGDLESTDFAEAVLRLKEQETAFQATLGVTARLLTPSLMDFLR
jgi:flagellar hook-associated protein 3 FlgL